MDIEFLVLVDVLSDTLKDDHLHKPLDNQRLGRDENPSRSVAGVWSPEHVSQIIISKETSFIDTYQRSGRVICRMSSQWGICGRILNGFGKGPDLYRARMSPILATC